MSQPLSPESPRERLLREASEIIAGNRDVEYGGPEDSFTMIAALWSVLFDRHFSTTDVAMAMSALKLARLSASDGMHDDSWRDLAGYAGCGYEVKGKRKV